MTARRAFTLVELLVAAAILSLALAAIGGVLGGAIRVWHAARTHVRLETDALPGLVGWERDLMNAQPCRQAPFAGTVDSLHIPAPGAGTDRHTPRFVRYRFDPARRTLFRTAWTVRQTEADAPIEAWIENVDRVRFEYRSDRDQPGTRHWSHPLNLPQAVQISLTLSIPGREPLQLRHTVVLPTAARQL